MKIAVEHLLPCMLVDLEGDEYADPRREQVAFQDLYQEVAFSRRETPDCQLVGFEGWDWCGFPIGHKVNVKGFDKRAYRDLVAMGAADGW